MKNSTCEFHSIVLQFLPHLMSLIKTKPFMGSFIFNNLFYVFTQYMNTRPDSEQEAVGHVLDDLQFAAEAAVELYIKNEFVKKFSIPLLVMITAERQAAENKMWVHYALRQLHEWVKSWFEN